MALDVRSLQDTVDHRTSHCEIVLQRWTLHSLFLSYDLLRVSHMGFWVRWIVLLSIPVNSRLAPADVEAISVD